jgi:hypothetical protein
MKHCFLICGKQIEVRHNIDVYMRDTYCEIKINYFIKCRKSSVA